MSTLVAEWVRRDLPPAPAGGADALRAPAQLIEFGRGRTAALPPHTVVELVDAPVVCRVPGTAYYCNRLLRWRGQWLPMVDLAALVDAHSNPYAAPARYALVVAWQALPAAQIAHGALALPSLPRVATVDDSQACGFEPNSDIWPWIATACFRHDGLAVPVLDTAALFTTFLG